MSTPRGRRPHRDPRRRTRRVVAILRGLAAGGCGEIGIHAGFRCLWALRPWRFESSQPHSLLPLLRWAQWSLPLSSRGLGRRPLTAETGVRIPVAVSLKALQIGGFLFLEKVRKSVRESRHGIAFARRRVVGFVDGGDRDHGAFAWRCRREFVGTPPRVPCADQRRVVVAGHTRAAYGERPRS